MFSLYPRSHKIQLTVRIHDRRRCREIIDVSVKFTICFLMLLKNLVVRGGGGRWTLTKTSKLYIHIFNLNIQPGFANVNNEVLIIML